MFKSIRYIIAAAAAVLLAGSVAYAQTKPAEEGIVVSKTATDHHDGSYTLTLESFVTGYTSNVTKHIITEKARPLDVVLVLDVSGSMTETMTGVSASSMTELQSQSYSYNGFGNNLYYKYKGQYYKVEHSHEGWLLWRNFALSFYVGSEDKTYYLSGTSITEKRPTGKDSNDTIWTGILYRTVSRMEALKQACEAFVNNIEQKASEDNVDHRIAVVKFAGSSSDEIGDDTDRNNYNYSQVVSGFSTNYTEIKSIVDGLHAAGATSVDYGMNHASRLISAIPSDRQSAKLVVMFTDGEPNHQSGFDKSVANSAISTSKTLKDKEVSVYTVGTFSNPSTNINKYMQYVSSNYPSATSMYNSGTVAETKYSMTTTDPSELTRVFTTIAQDESQTGSYTGGEDVVLEKGQVTVTDVITPSFMLPDAGVSAINVYALSCTGAKKTKLAGKSYTQHPVTLVDDDGFVWYDAAGYTWGAEKITGVVEDSDIEFTTDAKGYTTVSIKNYDFGANWVGLKESIDIASGSNAESVTSSEAQGQKLVIEIKIVPNPEAEGGSVTTNDPSSGIYIGDESVSIGDKPAVNFPVPPSVFTPKNLEISVAGLNEGETALFRVTSDDDSVDMVVAFTGGLAGQKTIAQLPVRRWDAAASVYKPIVYTVSELTDWTWKYGRSVSEITHDLMDVNSFDFTVKENSAASEKAKNAEATKINIFTHSK